MESKETSHNMQDDLEDLYSQLQKNLCVIQGDFSNIKTPYFQDEKTLKWRYEQLHIKYNQLKKDLIIHWENNTQKNDYGN